MRKTLFIISALILGGWFFGVHWIGNVASRVLGRVIGGLLLLALCVQVGATELEVNNWTQVPVSVQAGGLTYQLIPGKNLVRTAATVGAMAISVAGVVQDFDLTGYNQAATDRFCWNVTADSVEFLPPGVSDGLWFWGGLGFGGAVFGFALAKAAITRTLGSGGCD